MKTACVPLGDRCCLFLLSVRYNTSYLTCFCICSKLCPFNSIVMGPVNELLNSGLSEHLPILWDIKSVPWSNGRAAQRYYADPSITGFHSTRIYLSSTLIKLQKSASSFSTNRTTIHASRTIPMRYPRKNCEVKLVQMPSLQLSIGEMCKRWAAMSTSKLESFSVQKEHLKNLFKYVSRDLQHSYPHSAPCHLKQKYKDK